MWRSEAMRVAQPKESIVEDIEHQPRFGPKWPLRSVPRHIVLAPGHKAAGLAARLCLAGLQSGRRVIVLIEMAFVDHPADHSA
jgi:hypothetical protein